MEIGGTKLPDVEESKIKNSIKATEYLTRCCANDQDITGDAHSILFDLYQLYYSEDSKNDFEVLEHLVNDGLNKFPNHLRLNYQKGELYLKMGFIDKAKSIWNDIKK